MRLNFTTWPSGFIACLLLLAACSAAWPAEDMFSPELRSLAGEYRELRKQHGHFRGGKWNDDVDKYGGKLHRVMQELGKGLEKLPMKRADLVALLGEPDATQTQEGAEQLIYFWRGWHDYLYFVCEGDSIKRVAWYFAYE